MNLVLSARCSPPPAPRGFNTQRAALTGSGLCWEWEGAVVLGVLSWGMLSGLTQRRQCPAAPWGPSLWHGQVMDAAWIGKCLESRYLVGGLQGCSPGRACRGYHSLSGGRASLHMPRWQRHRRLRWESAGPATLDIAHLPVLGTREQNLSQGFLSPLGRTEPGSCPGSGGSSWHDHGIRGAKMSLPNCGVAICSPSSSFGEFITLHQLPPAMARLLMGRAA